MIYSDVSPYQILSTSTMDYLTLQKMNRFAKFWDLYANSGEFKNFMAWMDADASSSSFFAKFFAFSEYLSLKFSETHSLALATLAEQAWHYMNLKSAGTANDTIAGDYCFGTKRRDLPVVLKNAGFKPEADVLESAKTKLPRVLNQRQLNHLS
jgi:hypothetical protein